MIRRGFISRNKRERAIIVIGVKHIDEEFHLRHSFRINVKQLAGDSIPGWARN
jgi:hypothetical protein